MEMELVHAPVPDLKGLLTQSFEDWAQSGSSCALSGGPSALIFLPALRAANVDWARVTLFWVDERADGVDDSESNHALAERMLLSPLGARAPRAMRMPTQLPMAQAALAYDQLLADTLPDGALDLAILGVGEDGHLGALFPGTQNADPTHASIQRVVTVPNAPRPPEQRLSLSLPFLLQTKHIWLIAVGPRKLPMLHMALARTETSTPLEVVLRQGKDVTVFTDQVIRRIGRR
jgi:6-phosphogluconolactonase